MPGSKGSFLNYSEEAMNAAIEEVRLHKTPLRTAAKKFGVPRTTLKYKVDGKSPAKRRMGPASVLSSEEEAEICNWVEKMAKAGFPVTVEELTISVQKVIKAMNRPNPFKDGRPGKTWVKAFLRRNNRICKGLSQNSTVFTSTVTGANILHWFTEVHAYLTENSYDHILDDPSRLFSCGEMAFFLNPKGQKVIARKGDKTVYQQVNAEEKECVTVFMTGSASGVLAPTTVLFKCKCPSLEIAENFPKKWGLGITDSGWTTCEAFYEFIANIFYSWLMETQVTLPVILFVDGHVSYLSLKTSQFCDSRGIILVGLYPKATQFLQPMDVSVFSTLKEGWKKKVHQWRTENITKEESPLIEKKDFGKLLQEVIRENVTESLLSDGFRKCGLYPWDPQAVKVPEQQSEVQQKVANLTSGLRFLNESIGEEKLQSFRAALELDTWPGEEHDTSLFELWKNTKTKLDQLASGSKPSGGARALHELTLQDAGCPATGQDFQDCSNPHVPPSEISEQGMFSNTAPDSEEETNIKIKIEHTSGLSADGSRLSDTVFHENTQNTSTNQELVTEFRKEMFNDSKNIKKEPPSFEYEDMDFIKTECVYLKMEFDSTEHIKERMEELNKELADLKTQRQQRETEIDNTENMALKQRLQDILNNLLTEQLQKEHEYEELKQQLLEQE